ncbi:hypothetical protein LG651_07475 [Tamlana sp. 62-3]|uniref:Competence protein n=1 Tax=Neotamlana sargassicola TaxID=2883125 RepID=A0A9X1I774_9FLAO|nr:hypothetical protein [Tamlana sargassicola]MCB4808090.1 hypothetical protein [Tamlana sargassicola]
MSVFEHINETSNKAIDKGEEYLKKSQEYYRLKVFQQLTSSMSLLFKTIFMGALVLVAFLFLAISAAVAIGNALNSVPLGYLIVGGVFLLLSIIFYFARGFINNIVIRSLSKTFFE